MSHKYKVRYRIDNDWYQEADLTKAVQESPGIKCNDSPYGYADEIFIASIMRNKVDGSIGSVLLLDSVRDNPLSREMLTTVRDQINHYLEHHCES